MYYICNPTQIKIYVNSARKTAAQIQRELGCDVLINGGLFDMKTWSPCCWLKVDGNLLHTENWSDWGFGFENTNLRMDSSVNIAKYRNFITCVSILKGGTALKLSYPAELGGKRARTAIGIDTAGRVVAYCVPETTPLTPEELQIVMRQLGCVSALMLDGGGSSQAIMPNGKVQSSRIVHNYIALWTHQTEQPSGCPYAEPTHNVGRWCWLATKDEKKWVQWMLRAVYDPTLDVDGSFGKLSDAALRGFQRKVGIVDDGKCGKISREKLNEEYRRLKK